MGQFAVELTFFAFADEVGRLALHGWPVKPCSQNPVCQRFRALVTAADSFVCLGKKLVSLLVRDTFEPRPCVPSFIQTVVQD